MKPEDAINLIRPKLAYAVRRVHTHLRLKVDFQKTTKTRTLVTWKVRTPGYGLICVSSCVYASWSRLGFVYVLDINSRMNKIKDIV